ncbi:uncharacterized protein isoform X2 [Rhodnius prolixus]
MDSDSSSSEASSGRGECGDEGGGGESRSRTAGGDWSSDRANSDVSDDENFSRGAKSIDSPPESPPRGGGNLDSPPASPAAPGVGSPAPYSGSEASENSPRPPESPPSYLGSPPPQAQLPRTPPDYYPTSPGTYGPSSPASPVNGRSSSIDGPSSPGDDPSSLRDDRSSVGSPGGGRSSTTGGASSPASHRGSSSVDGRSTPTSPADRSTSSGGIRRAVRSSVTSNIRSPSVGHSSEGEESRSPTCTHARHTDDILSPEDRRSDPSSPAGRSLNPMSPVDLPSNFTRRRRTPTNRSKQDSPQDEPRSPIEPFSLSEGPNASSRLGRRNKGGPSTPQNRPFSPSSPERRFLTSADAPLSPTSPTEGPSSPEGRPTTPDSSHRSGEGRSSPIHLDGPGSPIDEDSFSPRTSRRRISGGRDSFPASPVEGPSSPFSHDERCTSPGNEPASPMSRPRRRSPMSPASSDGRSNISSDSTLGGSPEPNDIPTVPARAKTPSPVRHEKVEIKSHGEDLSDVSDIESLGSVSDNEQDKILKVIDTETKEKESILNGGSGAGTMALGEEAEQLDFEAEEREEPEGQLLEVSTQHQIEGMTSSSNNCNTKDLQSISSMTTATGTASVPADDEEEGEVKEREDGEISDEGEARPEETEPRPVCRFFSRGQCTWGSSCSFRHVTQTGKVVPTALGQLPTRGANSRFFRSWFRRGGVPSLRFFAPRFVHPGVTDKGNYTMFDMVRPLVPMNNGPPPPPHLFPGPIDVYTPRAIDRPIIGPGPPPFQQPAVRREEPPGESAWERGLRQAKELLRRSTKRKETDADFEEKKMNLGLSGQDEYDKENDYYTRPTSPIYEDTAYHERYPNKEGEKRYRSVSERFGDYPPPAPYYPPPRGENWYEERSSRYHHQSSRHHPSSYQPSSRAGGGNSAPSEDYYERPKRQKYSSREVIVQRSEKTQWKENSPSPRPRGSDRSGRGDEWADPWMRSKSPTRKGTGTTSRSTRKKSYSSRSSYSSSSTSRSSSYSSYSRSGSHSRSTRSRSSRSRSRSPFSRKKMSPLSRRANKSPFSRGERRGQDPERSMHMNPPAPSPRANNASPTARRNPTPPDSRSNRNLSARLLAAAMRDRSVSRSSRSSSASDSSGSSSDSSSDSGSSSSSSRGPSPTPPPPQQRILPLKQQQGRKKIEIDEKLAQAMKVKAMDALKLSGQKQQIKLTLKGPGSGTGKERVAAPVVSRKRVADSPLEDEDDDLDSPSITKKKPAPSRREELLKQLKAVEDAIARKRSKI